MTGATHAIDGRDRDAFAAWEAAVAAGIDGSLLAPLMIDAALRQGNTERAISLGTPAMASRPSDAVLTRRVAASHLAGNEAQAALALLNPLLDREPGDGEAQWLRLHAEFMEMIAGEIGNAPPQAREAFKQHAARYVESKGRHAPLAAEWAAVVP